MRKRVSDGPHPTDAVETRYPLYETNPEDRVKAFAMLDSLTPTIREFLAREDPFAGEGIEMNKADVAENNTILRYFLIGGTAFDGRHKAAVQRKLPGFELNTLFIPVHGSSAGAGAAPQGRMVLEFKCGTGGWKGISTVFHRAVSFFAVVFVLVMLYYLKLFVAHTKEDTDPFGVVRRLWPF